MTRLVGIVVIVALLLVGCGGTQDAAETADGTSQQAAERSDQVTTTPGLLVNTIDGGQVDIADLLDEDTVLWFWAPW